MKKIDELNIENINGVDQSIIVRGDNIDNPLILILHGGPGISCAPVFKSYNEQLESHYTVALWEQRGSGKSYYKFEKGTVNLKTFIDDAIEVVKFLRKKYNKDKIVLLAHSWGSVIGFELLLRHPEYFSYYFTCGQVVNTKDSLNYTIDYLKTVIKDRSISKVKSIDLVNYENNSYRDFMNINTLIIRNGGAVYKKSSYSVFWLKYLSPKSFAAIDGIKGQLGYRQTVKAIWNDFLNADYRNITKLEVPIVFTCGRHDKVVPSEDTYKFYEKLQGKKHFYWFENSAHCCLWEESDKFNEIVIKHKENITSN